MQIIFGEKCVLLLRLFFAAVLMLWCAQTAAYSGQCHTTQGNPYIGVNFGVKTLEEEENTAGVVKDKFYQWNESNDYYVSCDCDKDNVRSGRWVKRRTKSAKAFQIKYENSNFRASIETVVLCMSVSFTFICLKNIHIISDIKIFS